MMEPVRQASLPQIAGKGANVGRINSITGKLLVDAFWAALVAFVFGLCLGRTLIKQFDSLYFTGMVFSGALLIFVLFWTRRAVRPSATAKHSTSETAKKSARQFLASCIFFTMISATFGVAVSSVVWYSSDFIRTFGVVWFAGLTCVAILCVRRDAKRVTDGVSSPIAPD
jgi:Na+/melibiose symporter-like transporter